jgi:hypothetical protein
MATYKITLSKKNWSGGTDAIWYDTFQQSFFGDADCWQEITAIEPPTRECYRFNGYYSASSNGVQYIDDMGNFTDALLSLSITAAKTFYAQGTQKSWKLTLNDNNGEGGDVALYYRIGDGGYFDNYLCEGEPVATVTKPGRSGYDFDGYYNGTSTPGTQYIDKDGAFLAAFTSLTPTAAVTIYARWTANTYTLTFNYNSGTPGAETKTVTFGAAVGTLPTTTRTPDVFNGWYVDGTKITADTVWNIAEDKMAEARWTLAIAASVEDFFGLASSALVPIASTNGDEYHRATAAHNGKYENGVNQISGVWRNPSVTYVVKANTTVSVQLGKAFAAQKSGSTMTRSGYMITTVEIVTEIGKFPTVTVSAVANEGANAVNNFTVNANKFNVSVAVVARSKAQNLLNAISGGGYLQRVTLRGTCDPVVCEENLMPCASDIVNGRYELAAETVAPNGEAAPTMASAAGFAMVGVPKVGADSNFVRYSIDGRKEMV